MTVVMQHFHFLRPEWLWALLPLVLLLGWYALHKVRGGLWTKVIDPQLRDYVLTGGQNKQRVWPLILMAIAGILSIVALAGPAWEKLPQPVFKDQSALMILFDLSQSMNSQDIKPSRLHRARHKLTDILRERRGGQTGLIVFAGNAFVVTPLTDDTETINAHVPALNTGLMPAQGSRADLAIEKTLELFAQTGIRHGKILIITDGIEGDNINTALENLKNAGHQLLILGVGTSEGAPIPATGGGFLKDRSGAIILPKLDEDTLRELGERYRRITIDDSDILALLEQTPTDALNLLAESTELNTDLWRDEGYRLLPLILLMALLAFRRGLLVIAFVVLLPLSNPAKAFDWESLWLNNNQRGARALAKKETERAIKLLSDPELRGAALYRAEQYDAAVETLDGIHTPNALYNKGNALAKLQKIPEAIAAYDETLALDPEHEDAKYNRDQLIKQQEQQQQNPQDGENSDESQQDQSEDSQSQEQQQGDPSQSEDQQQPEDSQSGDPQNDPQDQSDPKQDEESSEQDQQEQQAENQQTDEQRDAEQAQAEATEQAAEETPPDEQQQAMEQWLRRIPDDPAGLLRRKFQHQHNQQQKSQPAEPKPW
jgi:Ca-activated chloride channel family protein